MADVLACEDREPAVFMQAFDDRGADYLLTPADAVSRCHGKGTSINVRVPARILA